MVQTEEKKELQKEVIQIARKRKLKRKLITIAIVFVLLVTCVLFVWIAGNNHAKEKSQEEIEHYKQVIEDKEKQIDELINTPIVVTPVSPEIVLDIIHNDLGETGELATIEYLFTDAARFTDSKQIKEWNIPLTEKSFLLQWDGVIKAGIKINQISTAVDEVESKIIITLPPAEILSYSIDYDSVKVLDEKDNIFNKITLDDRIKFDAANQKAMEARAIENGILEKAGNNAKDVIARLLAVNPAVGVNYSIEFVAGEK